MSRLGGEAAPVPRLSHARVLTRLRVVRSVRSYAADSYSSCRDDALRCGWRLPDLTRLDAAGGPACHHTSADASLASQSPFESVATID